MVVALRVSLPEARADGKGLGAQAQGALLSAPGRLRAARARHRVTRRRRRRRRGPPPGVGFLLAHVHRDDALAVLVVLASRLGCHVLAGYVDLCNANAYLGVWGVGVGSTPEFLFFSWVLM